MTIPMLGQTVWYGIPDGDGNIGRNGYFVWTGKFTGSFISASNALFYRIAHYSIASGRHIIVSVPASRVRLTDPRPTEPPAVPADLEDLLITHGDTSQERYVKIGLTKDRLYGVRPQPTINREAFMRD